MNGRGGKRQGAGRKASLSFEQKLAIVAEYQSRWWHLKLDEVNAKAEATSEKYALSENRDSALSGTPQERARAIALSQLPFNAWPDDLTDREQDVASGLKDYQEGLIILTERTRGASASPGVAIFGTRPHGKRSQLEREVASWANREFGVRITGRTVRRCVDEWQKANTLE